MSLATDKKELAEKLKECQKKLGYSFKNIKLLENALTHTSFKTPYNPSNERLEFLGDAILGMVISEYLFKKFSDYSEGKLTKIKSVVVSRATLAKIGTEMNLKRYISVGKGLLSSNSFPKSLIANVLEAIIAAIYIDGGLKAAYDFTLRRLRNEIDIVCNNKHEKNYKSILQHFCQRQHGNIPKYKIIKQSGPDHDKTFEVVTLINNLEYCTGMGNNKKEAEQIAARKTLESLDINIE
ncbi:MAG: ribonuclease III [Candidatus Scalindua rubra]|uniref:Ribonuclease 3 n=1 Tax=Candidatus Scalindua rubra TaxID=1872076 RepID=A0A1E3XG94_9BACT|nr:MAG: ribonuclease III [Candidatus Scalindua rubra]